MRTTVTEWVRRPNLTILGFRDHAPHSFWHRSPWHILGILLGRAKKLGLKPSGVLGHAPTISGCQTTTQLIIPEDAGVGVSPKSCFGVLGRCPPLASSRHVSPPGWHLPGCDEVLSQGDADRGPRDGHVPLARALGLVPNLDVGTRHLPDLADLAAMPTNDAADELEGQGRG